MTVVNQWPYGTAQMQCYTCICAGTYTYTHLRIVPILIWVDKFMLVLGMLVSDTVHMMFNFEHILVWVVAYIERLTQIFKYLYNAISK